MLLLLWSDFVYITIKLYTNNYSSKWILTHNYEYATTKLCLKKVLRFRKKRKESCLGHFSLLEDQIPSPNSAESIILLHNIHQSIVVTFA